MQSSRLILSVFFVYQQSYMRTTCFQARRVVTWQEKTRHALHMNCFSAKTPSNGNDIENILSPKRAGIWSTANNLIAITAPGPANQKAPMIFSVQTLAIQSTISINW